MLYLYKEMVCKDVRRLFERAYLLAESVKPQMWNIKPDCSWENNLAD